MEEGPGELAGDSEGRVFELSLRGRLSEGMIKELGAQRRDQGTTVVVTVRDRSALHGVIRRVEDLGLDLVSINEVEADVD